MADDKSTQQDQEAPRRGTDRRPADPKAKAGKPPQQPDPTKDKVAAGRVPKPATNLTQHAKGTGYSGDEAVIEDIPEPPRLTPDGLRLDGPGFDKWVEDGNDPNEYPPPSYADLRVTNEDGLRTDGPTYESWVASGKRVVDYPPPGFAVIHDGDELDTMTEQQVNEARARGEWPGREALGRLPGQPATVVEASAGAVDPPAAGVVRPISAGGTRQAGTQTGAVSAAPARDAVTGLRTDGPTYDEYLAGGFDGTSYPPAGYTDKRQPAGQWPANQPGGSLEPQQTRPPQTQPGGAAAGQGTWPPAQEQPPAQASSVLPSTAQGEAVDYGQETEAERKARLDRDNGPAF
jgi:hypothetical protein